MSINLSQLLILFFFNDASGNFFLIWNCVIKLEDQLRSIKTPEILTNQPENHIRFSAMHFPNAWVPG